MQATKERVQAMLELQGVPVPDDEIDDVVLRFSTWMAAFEEIEDELGDEMNDCDPIPPVYPREDF